MIDDSVFTTASTTATPLLVERAKVAALKKQLSRSLEDKKQLQAILNKTNKDLEMSQKKTLQLQRAQIKKVANQKQQVSVGHKDEVKELKAELASTQKELADEIESSKKRELRVQRLHEQLAASKEQQSEQKRDVDNHEHNMKIKTLRKQREELLLVVKRQIKLIEVLRQQRLHVESAAEVLEVKY